ncbi:MAG: tripartite tricarboxylate transporter TctB family protein [Pseudomonadota bacterium]
MSNLPERRFLHHRHERFWVALILFAFGVFVAWHATSYELGSLRRMGPGYFPLILGLAQCLFAIMIFVSPQPPSDFDASEIPDGDLAAEKGNFQTKLRAFGFILGAMIIFAAMIRPTGFVPATAVATFVAGLAEPDNSIWDLVLLSLGITVFASLVFVVGLGVPVPLVAF